MVADSESPVGAWQLRRVLAQKGVGISEATCGRVLREMEDLGHVESFGHKGRVITSQGRQVLKEWQEKKVRDRSQMAFMRSLSVRGPEELKDVLVARRAIEGETAALAAVNATPEQVTLLKDLIRKQAEVLKSGASAVEQNAAFHRTLAAASSNKVLLATLDVIFKHPDVMRALEYIREQVGSTMVEDHTEIIEKILDRNPEGAKAAMVKHLDRLIDDVDTYWRERVGAGGLEHESH